MYSTHNAEISVVVEGFIRTLENKIYKYMSSISKNVYINNLDDIVNKYNNTYHRTIKRKPVDIKSNTYINSSKQKFKVGDHIRILKYKNTFAKGYVLNWSEEFFVIRKVKTLCCGHMLLVILMEKKCFERFTKKNCKKQIKNSSEVIK